MTVCVPLLCVVFLFLFYGYGDHRDLHVLTHSFPTRRSSDLPSSPRTQSCPPPWRGRGRACSRGAWAVSPMTIGQGRRQERQEQAQRSEEHTSELQSLMRISYAVFCLKKKTD